MKKGLDFIFLFFMIFSIDHSAHADALEKPFLTRKQEEFFSLNMPVYAYFARLYVDKKTPEQIAKEYGLSDITSQKYLQALEDVGVI